MHRSETRELGVCVECGAEIAPARERSYVYGPDACLCFSCAVRRGGSYDETHDRWVTAPDTQDLSPPE